MISALRLGEKRGAVGWIMISLAVLNLISLVCIYSALNQGGVLEKGDIFHKQIIWIGMSWLCLIIFSAVNYRLCYDIAYPFYALNLLLLLAVEATGTSAMGATRWLSLGGFNFQPSESCKLAAIFVMARLFSRRNVTGFWGGVFFPLILVGISAVLIVKQPDLGTALVVMFLFFAVGLSSRLRKIYFVGILAVCMGAAPLFWHHLKDYQKQRLVVFVNPDVDPLGAGYNIIQSKIAIGSGRLLGKGFMAGTQNQFNFMPERHTDFIFTVLAEEWGFAGAIALLMIYWLMLSQILDIAAYARDEFARLLAVGMGSLIFLHVFINIAMTMGVVPVVGIPLVFMSYGGSNLLINFLMMGILVNIARQSR